MMLRTHASVMDFLPDVNRKRRNGRVTASGTAVKINVYWALVVVSLLRRLVIRFSCSV